MIRLALLSSTFLPTVGGAELVVHHLASRLSERGHDVTVVTTRTSARRLPPLPYAVEGLWPATMPLIASRRWGAHQPALLMSVQLAEIQRRLQPDVWHVHMAFPDAVAAGPFLTRRRSRWFVTCHGVDILTAPELGYGYRLDPGKAARIKRWLPKATGVVAVSPSMEIALRNVGISEGRLHRIPNGVDVERIRRAHVDREQVRKALGVRPGQAMVLTVGRNDPVKRYDVLVDALAEMQPSPPRWVVVGRRTAGLGHHDQLVTIDEISHDSGCGWESVPPRALIELYRAADLLVLPSQMEAFSVVAFEAFAAGLPVVTTDGPGCRDIAALGASPPPVPVGDASALARAVSLLLNDPALHQSLRAAAHKLADDHRWDRVVAATEAMYLHG